MPQFSLPDDLDRQPCVIHAWHGHCDNEYMRGACGITWRRGDPPARFSGERDRVTCEKCLETLEAARGMIG